MVQAWKDTPEISGFFINIDSLAYLKEGARILAILPLNSSLSTSRAVAYLEAPIPDL